ncbi:MAG: hypothetical protein V1872_00525 [bacterium]
MNDSQDTPITQSNKNPQSNSKKKNNQRRSIIILTIILCLAVALVIVDFFTTIRIKEISPTENLDARNGKIIIKYSRSVSSPIYRNGSDGLTLFSKLSEDGLTETETILYPTKYYPPG